LVPMVSMHITGSLPYIQLPIINLEDVFEYTWTTSHLNGNRKTDRVASFPLKTDCSVLLYHMLC
jgi:hypothetical protein